VKTKQKTSSQFNRQHLGIIRKLSAKLADNLSFSYRLSMLTLKIVVNVVVILFVGLFLFDFNSTIGSQPWSAGSRIGSVKICLRPGRRIESYFCQKK